MRIIFNLIGCGTNNNGGSMTLIKSANTLKSIGIDVVIIDSGETKYTWGPIEVPYIIEKNIENLKADAIICSSMISLDSTEKSTIKNKYIWIRGWETWVYPEEVIVDKLKKSSVSILVNSQCLKDKLNSFGLESIIIRPGYDFDEIYQIDDIRNSNVKHITLGGLFSSTTKKKRQTKRTQWIYDTYDLLSDRGYNITLEMIGSDGYPQTSRNIIYNKSPEPETKNKFYNRCDIWLATSELEGLHIPPAEAMLTGCPVVGTNTPMSGTQDYLINMETGLISDNNLISFISSVETLICDTKLRRRLGLNAKSKIKSMGDRKYNMTKLIDFIQMGG